MYVSLASYVKYYLYTVAHESFPTLTIEHFYRYVRYACYDTADVHANVLFYRMQMDGRNLYKDRSLLE